MGAARNLGRFTTVVAVDEVGRVLGEKQVRAINEGHLVLVQWAARFDQVAFALEDCRRHV